jgi:hypothetical protein
MDQVVECQAKRINGVEENDELLQNVDLKGIKPRLHRYEACILNSALKIKVVGEYEGRMRRERARYYRKQGLSGIKPRHTCPEFCYTTRTFAFGHDREQVVITLSGRSLVKCKARSLLH